MENSLISMDRIEFTGEITLYLNSELSNFDRIEKVVINNGDKMVTYTLEMKVEK